MKFSELPLGRWFKLNHSQTRWMKIQPLITAYGDDRIVAVSEFGEPLESCDVPEYVSPVDFEIKE